MLPESLGFHDPSSWCPGYGWPRSPATEHAGDQAQTSASIPQLQTAQTEYNTRQSPVNEIPAGSTGSWEL